MHYTDIIICKTVWPPRDLRGVPRTDVSTIGQLLFLRIESNSVVQRLLKLFDDLLITIAIDFLVPWLSQ